MPHLEASAVPRLQDFERNGLFSEVTAQPPHGIMQEETAHAYQAASVL